MVLQVLQVGLYVQVLLGLARFGLPFVGVVVPEAVWTVHPLLGVAIAVTALVMFRPASGRPTRPLVLARYAPLAPLLLGAAIMLGWVSGLWVVVGHMVLGFTAIELVGRGITAV
ncbi:MAG TPA: hypothetical protein VK875_12100 [Euzebyales bacterium]|nr:hypothetical protein [Euzebyales bacterium]